MADLVFSFGVMLFVAAFGYELNSRRWRPVLIGCFSLMIALACVAAFESKDHSIWGLSDRIGVLMCGGLTLLGLWDPRRFFVAFRIVAVLPLVRMLAWAGPDFCFGAVMCLPGLMFAWKARPRPAFKVFHLLLEASTLPTFEGWQEFLRHAGLDILIQGSGDLRDHTGKLPVVFQGRPLTLQFSINPLSQLIAENRLPDSFAERLGNDGISAVFRYDNEHERPAAFVAAASLMKLTGITLIDGARDRWLNASDAFDDALDIALPNELHVLAHDENLPTSEQWQSALNESGPAIASWEPFDIRDYAGFLPLTVQRTTMGFTFALSPAEFLIGGDLFPIDELPSEFGDKALSADFRSGAGRHSLAAEIAAAIFAQIAKGTVYNPRTQTFSSGPEAFEAARMEVIEGRVGDRLAD